MNASTSDSTGETGYKRFFGLDLAELLASKIAAVEPRFTAQEFLADARSSDLTERELLERVNLQASLLRRHLPASYPDALNVLGRTYGPENPNETGMFTFGYWLWPVGSFISTYGLNHHKPSIAAIEELTKRHTGEYAIRPYITSRPDDTRQVMRRWAESPNVHVRRLASEGLRPRLPWAKKLTLFIEHPEPVFDVLDALKDDTSRFVQKSVANNLNDYLKDNRPAAMSLLQRWTSDVTPHRQWTIRHALRNEVKREADDALTILDQALRNSKT